MKKSRNGKAIIVYLNKENGNGISTQTRYPHISAWGVICRVDHVTSRCFTTWANFLKCLWLGGK